MTPPIYNFPDTIIKGDTFPSLEIKFPFIITDACILMQFKRRAGDPPVFEWKTSDNTLAILNATSVLMTSRKMDYPVYNFIYDLKVTFPDGTAYTYFQGTLKINQNISEKCQ